MDLEIPNSLVQDEDDDFALDPGLWQWDEGADEWIAYTAPGGPDPEEFLDLIRESMTLVEANDLLAKYPLAFQALQTKDWAYLQELIIHAHTIEDIGDAT